jgi:hypothetical protein
MPQQPQTTCNLCMLTSPTQHTATGSSTVPQALFAGFLEADKACRSRHRVSGTTATLTLTSSTHLLHCDRFIYCFQLCCRRCLLASWKLTRRAAAALALLRSLHADSKPTCHNATGSATVYCAALWALLAVNSNNL